MMTRNIEDILKNTDLPNFESGIHRQSLRRHLLDEWGRRSHRATHRKRIFTIAVTLLASFSILVSAGVALQQIIFKGKKDGVYKFQTPVSMKKNVDGSTTTTERVYSFKGKTIDVVQTQKDLQEVEYLRQQDNRELVGIIETADQEEVLNRTYRYRYTLSDGRKITIGGNDPDGPTSEKMKTIDVNEIWKLRRAGKGEPLPVKEEIVKGKTFVFERHKITLSDGRVVILSVAPPLKPIASKTAMPELKREGFALHPNVPNPFNPQTTLRYELAQVSEIRISVYNLMGQEIRTLVNQQKGVGSHQVVWDGRDDQGRDVASGTYLIRMLGPQFTQTQKVSLIR